MNPQRYWPFPMPPEVRPQESAEVQFLETAYDEGFRPYEIGAGDYGATSGAGRSGHIFVRGRTRREILLDDLDGRVLSAYLADFSCAAAAVLDWLRGEDVESIFRAIEDRLVSMPGARHRFQMRGDDAPIAGSLEESRRSRAGE